MHGRMLSAGIYLGMAWIVLCFTGCAFSDLSHLAMSNESNAPLPGDAQVSDFWARLSFWLMVLIGTASTVAAVILAFQLTHFYTKLSKKDLIAALQEKVPFYRKVGNTIVVFTNIEVSLVHKTHCVNMLIDAHFANNDQTSVYCKVRIKSKLVLDRISMAFYLTHPQIAKIVSGKISKKNQNDLMIACHMLIKYCPVSQLKIAGVIAQAKQIYLRSARPDKDALVLRMRYLME